MHSNAHPAWAARISTFVLAAAVAGSAVYWGLQWSAPTAGVPVLAVDTASAAPVDTAAVAQALGASGAEAPAGAVVPSLAASRFVLTGVVAGRSQQGAALIAVDGKPPKPFAVGARVADDWTLRSVQPRRAALVRARAAEEGTEGATAPSDAAHAELVLELPALPASALFQSKKAP